MTPVLNFPPWRQLSGNFPAVEEKGKANTSEGYIQHGYVGLSVSIVLKFLIGEY